MVIIGKFTGTKVVKKEGKLNSAIFLWHAVSHSYNMMVSFAFFVFVRHTAHCFLLLVSCMLYVVKKHCPEEAHLSRWAKRRIIMMKIARRANLSA